VGCSSNPARLLRDVEVLRRLSGIVEVFSTPAGDLYTTVVEQGCRRTLPLDADEFRSWLVAEFYAARGRAPVRKPSPGRALFSKRGLASALISILRTSA